MFFMRDESPSSCLALGQSGRTENSIQILSITVATSSGGLVEHTNLRYVTFVKRIKRLGGKRWEREERGRKREKEEID